MFDSNSLSDKQISAIHLWASEGAQINDIQKRLVDDFSINITFMEARFLVLDLEVEIIKEEEPEEPEEEKPEKIATGEVHVVVDTIVRPGAAVSGSVEFSDGEKAQWAVDTAGQLKLDADEPGYRPSEFDVQQFQDKLREQLQAMG